MVHLSQIPTDASRSDTLVEGMKSVKLDTSSFNDTFTTTVYGSKFAAQDLPKLEMPECEMPKEVAYRMIKDDLSLDGNPMLNLASFVTTYMVRFLPLPAHLRCECAGRRCLEVSKEQLPHNLGAAAQETPA
jgi:hypothetical protein